MAKYKNADLARCALGVDDATHVDVSRCGGYIIASGGTVAPQIFPAPGATTRHVDAPACRLPSGSSGFRFYYLDRFVVGPDGVVKQAATFSPDESIAAALELASA